MNYLIYYPVEWLLPYFYVGFKAKEYAVSCCFIIPWILKEQVKDLCANHTLYPIIHILTCVLAHNTTEFGREPGHTRGGVLRVPINDNYLHLSRAEVMRWVTDSSFKNVRATFSPTTLLPLSFNLYDLKPLIDLWNGIRATHERKVFSRSFR